MADVEARLAALEKELSRLHDERDIQELMGRHTLNHTAKNMHKTLSFFALDEPDVSVEVGDRGVYKGRNALETLFREQFGSAALRGNLLFPFLTTGMVEVAGDGKTAKGTWRSPCVQAVMPKDGKGEPTPIWLFGAYAVDFMKKGSEWKIWHFHWFRTIKCSHEEGWVKDRSWLFAGPLDNSPDLEPTTYHNPYTPESIQDSIPPCPRPYETYDSQEWMVTEQADLWKL